MKKKTHGGKRKGAGRKPKEPTKTIRIPLSKLSARTVIDVEPVSLQEMIDILHKHKPKEIYNLQWSSKIPFIVITEYDEDQIVMYCNGEADKTPYRKTLIGLYDFLKYQGLSDCFFSAVGEKI